MTGTRTASRQYFSDLEWSNTTNSYHIPSQPHYMGDDHRKRCREWNGSIESPCVLCEVRRSISHDSTNSSFPQPKREPSLTSTEVDGNVFRTTLGVITRKEKGPPVDTQHYMFGAHLHSVVIHAVVAHSTRRCDKERESHAFLLFDEHGASSMRLQSPRLSASDTTGHMPVRSSSRRHLSATPHIPSRFKLWVRLTDFGFSQLSADQRRRERV